MPCYVTLNLCHRHGVGPHLKSSKKLRLKVNVRARGLIPALTFFILFISGDHFVRSLRAVDHDGVHAVRVILYLEQRQRRSRQEDSRLRFRSLRRQEVRGEGVIGF